MINRIYAYTVLNVKSLLKDKISFVWSILLPLIMFFINAENIYNENEITYWWVYMVLCSYIYGIGVYALELKEEGSLRIIFSINNSSIAFFLGNLVTQVIFSSISILFFDIVVILIKQFSIFKVMSCSIKCIILCLPFALLGYGLTLFSRCHVNTIRTIFTILIFGMFMLIGVHSRINAYNPLCYISNYIMEPTKNNVESYILFTLISYVIGIVGIIRFNPNSNERR